MPARRLQSAPSRCIRMSVEQRTSPQSLPGPPGDLPSTASVSVPSSTEAAAAGSGETSSCPGACHTGLPPDQANLPPVYPDGRYGGRLIFGSSRRLDRGRPVGCVEPRRAAKPHMQQQQQRSTRSGDDAPNILTIHILRPKGYSEMMSVAGRNNRSSRSALHRSPSVITHVARLDFGPAAISNACVSTPTIH